MKCAIAWIDENAHATPDCNPAVAIAKSHILSLKLGENGKRDDIGYLPTIGNTFPICAEHYARVTPEMLYPVGGWEFEPLIDDTPESLSV